MPVPRLAHLHRLRLAAVEHHHGGLAADDADQRNVGRGGERRRRSHRSSAIILAHETRRYYSNRAQRRTRAILPPTSSAAQLHGTCLRSTKGRRCRAIRDIFPVSPSWAGAMSVNDDLPWIPPGPRAHPRGGAQGRAGARALPRRPAHVQGLRRQRARQPRTRRSAGARCACATTAWRANGSASCSRSSPSSGTARPSASRRAPRACSRMRTAPTRRSPSASTSACNATSR